MSSNRVTQVFDRLLRENDNDNDNKNKNNVLLLDGGTGEELFLNGVPDDRKTWSALAVTDPQYHSILKKVHRSFLRAGSQAITTNSYSLTPICGFTQNEIARYASEAGRLAREVVAEEGGEDLVFGSLGPLNESYRADLVMPHKDGVKIYNIMVDALKVHVDCFLAETMSSIEESKQVVEAVGSEKPLLVSFTLSGDGTLRSGEEVSTATKKLLDFAQKQGANILGVLFNCSEPEAISIALGKLHDDPTFNSILFGAYANRLTAVDPNWSMAESDAPQPMRPGLTPAKYCDEFVSKWVGEYDARLVGGCCGIGPAHISKLHDRYGKK